MSIRDLLFSCLILIAMVGQSAADGDIGLGIIAGEPTGLSLKMWVGDRDAVDVAVGWSLGEEGWFYGHCDYLHHWYDLDPEEVEGTLPYYVGIGCRIRLRDGDNSKLGIRIPIGLDYVFPDKRFDVFMEVAPILNLIPETEFDWSGGIGVRYWF
jgi:hypothetical protein